jgi:hypothetical protein
MLSIITLPANFTASTTQVMGELFTDLGPYILLVIGVILGVVVLEIIIGVLRK